MFTLKTPLIFATLCSTLIFSMNQKGCNHEAFRGKYLVCNPDGTPLGNSPVLPFYTQKVTELPCTFNNVAAQLKFTKKP